MVHDISQGLIALAGVLLGAEIVVRYSLLISKRYGISDFYIGLTILSIGTSLPEISTHIISSLKILSATSPNIISDFSDLAVSTNIGSNIIQITVIVGIVAIFGKLTASEAFLKRDYMVMLGAILLLWFFSANGYISRLEGTILVSLYLIFLYYISKSEHLVGKVEHISKDRTSKNGHVFIDVMMILIGLGFLLQCADIVLTAAENVSIHYGIATGVIGALVIGVSTALPELATSVLALKNRSTGMSIGTLVGSNITNPMLALGIGAMISSYTVSRSIIWYQLPFWFFISLIVLFFLWKKKRLYHFEASLLILSYILYAFFLSYLFR